MSSGCSKRCLGRVGAVVVALGLLNGCRGSRNHEVNTAERVGQLQDEVARLRVEIENRTAESARLQAELARRDQQLAAASGQSDQLRQKVENLQRTLDVLRRGLAEARGQLARREAGTNGEAVAPPAAPPASPPAAPAVTAPEVAGKAPEAPPPTAGSPQAPAAAASEVVAPASATPPPPGPAPAVTDPDAIPRAVVLIEGDRSAGTGFLVRQDDHVFLYTAAHVLSGNDRLAVKMNDGTTLRRFGALAAAEGADLVRLEVLDPVKESATLSLVASGGELAVGTPISAWGNGGGQGVVARERGRVLGSSATSLEVDAAIIQGNSGGPVVRAADGKVLGLVTHLAAGRDDIWAAGTRHAQVRRFACRLDRDWPWKSMSVTAFLQDAKRLEQFDRTTRLSLAIGALEPTDAGLRLDLQMPGGLTAAKIIEENGDARLVQELLELNKRLAEKKTKTSESDWRRQLRRIIDECLGECGRTAATLAPDKMAWFHRRDAESSLEWRKNAVNQLRQRSESLR